MKADNDETSADGRSSGSRKAPLSARFHGLLARFRLSKWLPRAGAYLLALFTVSGAVVAWVEYIDSKQIDLRLVDVEPYVDRGPYLGEPFFLGVVNDSQKGTSLASGEVLYQGRVLGTIDQVVPAPPPSDRPDLAELNRAARRLPFPIPGGSSVALALMWNGEQASFNGLGPPTDWRQRYLTSPPSKLKSPVRVKCPDGTTTVGGSFGGRGPLFRTLPATVNGRPEFTIRLKFDPGGTRTVSVEDNPPFDPGSTLEELLAPPASGSVPGRPGWVAGVMLGNMPEPREVRWLYAAGPVQAPGFTTLRIWAEDASSPRQFTRPISAEGVTCFPVGDLAPGQYQWAVVHGGQAVLTGQLLNPCPRPALRKYQRDSPLQPIPVAVCAP
jgi:hypothetical protein